MKSDPTNHSIFHASISPISSTQNGEKSPKHNVEMYQCPRHFLDDWMNLYWDYVAIKNKQNQGCQSDSNYEDDFRFVYAGPRGSWTPLHKDVFSSYR
jgi:hypothetical protein